MFQTNVVEIIKTHFVFSDVFFENRAVYEKKWKNIVERDRPQMTIWRKLIARSIPKATNTNPECVIFIAFAKYCDVSSLHAGYLRLQTQTQNV
jgi:hypothetical protein